MTPVNLIVIGGGEHARVVIEAAQSRAESWVVLGFVDPSPCEDTCSRLGVSWLGDDDILGDYPDALAVLGFGSLGDVSARSAAVERASTRVRGWASVIHCSAIFSATAEIAPGAVVGMGSTVTKDVAAGAVVMGVPAK